MFAANKDMKKILFTTAIIALTVIGCSRGDNEWGNEAYQICLLSDIQGGAAPSKVAYNSGDAISGLQFLRIDALYSEPPTNFENATLVSGNRVDNSTYISFDTPQFYNEDYLWKSFFIGYYPVSSYPYNGKSATWNIDGKIDVMTTEFDIYNGGNRTFWDDLRQGIGVAVIQFRHALAQLEVICTSEQGTTETARERWGQIEYIKIKETAPYVEFWFHDRTFMYINYFPEAIALSQADYTADFAPIDIPDAGSTVVNAAGMFAPSGQKFSLLVKMKNSSADQEVLVDMGASKSFDKGKRHIVTVIFSAKEIKVKTTIDEWKTGDSNTIQIQ